MSTHDYVYHVPFLQGALTRDGTSMKPYKWKNLIVGQLLRLAHVSIVAITESPTGQQQLNIRIEASLPVHSVWLSPSSGYMKALRYLLGKGKVDVDSHDVDNHSAVDTHVDAM